MENKWAYLAGVFDIAGCVNITESRGRHRLQVAITRKDEGFLDKLHRLVDAGITDESSWRAVTQEAEDFLRGILPHSLRKKEQIEVALEFRGTIGRTGNYGRRGLSGSVKDERERLMLELQELKQ